MSARIMIVEDEVSFARDLRRRVESLGHTVTANVTSGEAALQSAEDEHPDLALMAINLAGEMDGIEAAEILRSRWQTPVVFIIAQADEERLKRAKLTLPFGYLRPPIAERDLKITIDMALYTAEVDGKWRTADEALRKCEHELGERVKELNCLYGISHLIEKENASLDDVLRGMVELIPLSWQYSEVACAKVTVGDSEHKTANFRRTDWRQEAEIVAGGTRVGRVEVCYLEQRPENDEGPFLKEERRLINAIAERLGKMTERKRAGEALRKSEELLRKSQAIAHIGSWELDLVANQLTWSEEVYRMFGLSPQDFGASYEAFLDLVHPDDRAAVDDAYSGSLREGRDSYEIEHRIVRRDTGEVRVVHEKCEHFKDASDQIVRSVGMVQDVTERRLAEEKLKASLAEKDVLLREIHHRVKNNMQVVISLLRLQSGAISDPQARAAFIESEDRIKAMALVHERLYRSESLSAISCRRYVEELVKGIARSHRGGSATLSADIGDVTIHIDQAVPLGLIVNELVANAMEHAFPGDRRGEVKVTLRAAGEHELKLEVSDDGVGLPEEIDPEATHSLGLRLVVGLGRDQLGGRIEVSRDGGTRFSVIFKKKLHEE